jgi:hypothetical protein
MLLQEFGTAVRHMLFLNHNVNLNCPAVINQKLNEFKVYQMFLYFSVIEQIKWIANGSPLYNK